MKAKPTNIKPFLVRMVMTLLMLVTLSQGASAMDLITDVMVIGGTQTMTNYLKTNYKNRGWKVIDQNLNEGAGGDYIYLLYKTTSDEDPNATFITGFAYNNSPMDEMLLSDGRIYSLVPYDGGSDFMFSQGNLNNNAGGIPLYLYYIKANSTDEQHVVKSITFNNNPQGATPEIDFNFGCEGAAEIYMHVDKTKGWTYRQISQTACTMSFEGPKAGIHSFNVPSTYKGLDVIAVSGLNGCVNLETLYFNSDSHVEQMPLLQDCTKLKRINLLSPSGNRSEETPASITSIPDYAFIGTAIENLLMPSVTSVGYYAFEGCKLSSVTFNQSNVQIGYRAFSNIRGDCKVTYPGSINNWSPHMYVYSPNMVVYASDGSCGWCGGADETSDNHLYWTLDYATGHLNFDWLWEGTLENQVFNSTKWETNMVKSITMNHVYAIGDNAFAGCSNLSSVNIPNSVTSIGNGAFYGCSNLPSVTIPNGVTSIGEEAFFGCSNLSSVNIPNGVTSIGNGAFYGCSNLPSVFIPNSVTSIGNGAFSWCSNLSFVNIPNSVTNLGNTVFTYCSSLTSVTIPNSVTYIGWDAFFGCSAMTDVYCYVEPTALTWYEDHCDDFKANRATKFHVYNASDWSRFVSKVNVTFVGDLPVELADKADNSTVLDKWNGRNVYTMLKGRTLYIDNKWNTLCLPFDLDDFNGTPLEGFTVKELDTENENGGHKTGCEYGTLYLNFKDATSIKAGKPYIVKKSVEADFVISSDADWNNFAQNVKSGTTYEGKVVGLGFDINVSTMAGTAVCPFKGTFDGNGHTINVNLNGGGEALALFYVIDGATIQNVKVTGTITSSNHRPATFAAFVEGNSTIKNCWSSVDIVSTRTSSWVDGGAFVARVSAGATLDMRDCAFIGTVTYNGGTSGGGMVGFTQTNATANLANCLFSPSALTLTVNAYNPCIFVSGDERGNLTNCYYNDVAKDSPLTKEGIDASLMSIDALAAALGKNWEASGNNAQPFCTSGIYNPIFGSVTIKNVAPAIVTSTDNAVSFTGSYNPVTASTPDLLYLGADNKLCYPSDNMTIGSCRACFHLPGGIGDNSMGDVNGDGQVSVNDVMAMVAYVLGVVNSGFIVENADLNGDGQISVNDVMALVKIILQGNQSISDIVINGADGITFCGGGTVPARAGEKQP